MVPDSKTDVMERVPGQIGKYRLVGQIGHGGMAEVFLAVSSGLGGFNKLCVLKLLSSDFFDTEEGIRAFKDEARLAALLNHPNVVQTYEVGEDNGNVYMVMEYLEGENLQATLRYLRRIESPGGFSLDMRLRVVLEILNGLHYAHELRDLGGQPLNLVHRDVTPHNIFITYNGGIKLLDFGIAKTTSASAATQVGTIKGKAGYMAPEQVTSPGEISRRTDIFQIGLVLWEGVIGRRVWEGFSDTEVILKLAKNVPHDMTAPQGADPELVRICHRAIAVQQESRYETAEEFATELEAYVAARGIRTRAKDVGVFVAQLFSSHRQALNDAIQRRLRDIETARNEASVLPDRPIPALFAFESAGHSGSNVHSGVAAMGFGAGTGSHDHVEPAPRGAVSVLRSYWKLAALVGLIATTVGAGIWLTTSGSSARVPGLVPSAALPAVKNTGTVQLSVAASPSHARLYLDNTLLPTNPFRGPVTKDDSTHAVRAEAAGFVTSTISIRLDRDVENMLSLAQLPAPVEPAAPHVQAPQPLAPPSRPTRPSRATRGSPGAVPAGIATPAADIGGKDPTPTPTPPKSKAPAAPAVKLDDSDPWR